MWKNAIFALHLQLICQICRIYVFYLWNVFIYKKNCRKDVCHRVNWINKLHEYLYKYCKPYNFYAKKTELKYLFLSSSKQTELVELFTTATALFIYLQYVKSINRIGFHFSAHKLERFYPFMTYKASFSRFLFPCGCFFSLCYTQKLHFTQHFCERYVNVFFSLKIVKNRILTFFLFLNR